MSISLISLLCPESMAQEYPVYKTDDIIVTANRTATTLGDLTRNVVVISSDEIARIPANNINDLLEYVSGVDVVQRGADGVQADVSVRGCSFEQTLILIDGFKINDPQTGHHNLDLPIIPADIERIEILKGHGSHLYGPNAFGGVINFITGRGNDNSAELKVSGGDFNYGEGQISASRTISDLSNHISFSRKKSDGFRPGAEFQLTNIYFNSTYNKSNNGLSLSFGHTDKEFGAYSFYSDLFPDEWEHTKTYFINASSSINNDNFSVIPKVFWRRHEDDFVLDRERPEWYRNEHTTDIYGLETQVEFQTSLGSTVFGGEYAGEEIESNSLGGHNRSRTGIFIEHNVYGFEKLLFSAGANASYFTKWGWTLNPSFDAGYYIFKYLKIYSSTGSSFRVPTFTELFYVSPANIGDENLKPEKSYSYEFGISSSLNRYRIKAGAFLRDGKDLIDWTRQNSAEPWRISNISSMTTGGFEFEFAVYPDLGTNFIRLTSLRTDYTFLDSNRKTGAYESKYALNYLRHQMRIGSDITIGGSFLSAWRYRYEDRVNGKSFSLVDLRIRYTLGNFATIIDIANLLDTEYADIASIPMPGRWFKIGVSYNFSSRGVAAD